MNTKAKTCECGESFKVDIIEQTLGLDFSWMEPSHCDACTERMNAVATAERRVAGEKIAAEWLDGFRATVARSIPPLFRATDTEHPKFNQRAWGEIQKWEPTTQKPWMGLSGGTGGCKSRIAYMMAQAMLERMAAPRAPKTEEAKYRDCRQPSFRLTTSYAITETVMAQFAGDDESRIKARRWLDATRKAELLLIDDLGKGKLSPAVSSEMFAMIDHRHVNQMVTIWTSNSTPENIAGSMTDDMGAPFAGRINESSRIFRFKRNPNSNE